MGEIEEIMQKWDVRCVAWFHPIYRGYRSWLKWALDRPDWHIESYSIQRWIAVGKYGMNAQTRKQWIKKLRWRRLQTAPFYGPRHPVAKAKKQKAIEREIREKKRRELEKKARLGIKKWPMKFPFKEMDGIRSRRLRPVGRCGCSWSARIYRMRKDIKVHYIH